MKFWTKDRQGGSVTVVLTMVLVPIVVIAGLFVDGGRGHLARSVVRSAEQLVLNDVLAQHDDELRTLFGLLAVIDDEGLDATATELLAANLTPGEGGDILQIAMTGDAQVTPVANANLAQSEVLANQIVEFMKYRAPASFMGDLLASLEWLKSLETGMAMVRARIAYLNKVSDVIEEANELVKELQEIETALQALLDDIDDMVSLLNDADDNIASIYADAFELVLRDHAGEDISDADIDRVDAGLARVNSTITGLKATATDFYTKATAFDPTGLVEKIQALREPGGARDQLDSAIDAHEQESAGSAAEESDAEIARDELEDSDALLDTIEEALDAFSTDLMESVKTRSDQFVTDFETALTAEVPNFATINSYATFKNFGRSYLEGHLDKVEEGVDGAIAAAVDGAKEDFEQAFLTLKSEIKTQLQTYLKEQVKAALDLLKQELAGLFEEELSGGGVDIFKELFKMLGEKYRAYESLIKDLTEQRASKYLGDGSEMSGERPSAGTVLTDSESSGEFGAIDDKDQLASETDSVLEGVIQLVGKLGQILENLRDAVLITEYVMGQFTYSTVEHGSADGDPVRLTQSAFPDCWNDSCAAEAEYVLTGMNSAAGTYGMVFLIRLASNMVTAFRDPVVMRMRAMISGIPIVGAALAFVVPVVAAVMQSADDMTVLHGGGAVPLYSKSLSIMNNRRFLDLLPARDGDLGTGGGKRPVQGSDGPELTYKNYVEIFLIVMTFINQDAVVMRSADIIQFNKGYLGDEGFRLSDAHTAFTVSAEYEMKPLVSTFLSYDAGGELFSGDDARRRLTTVGGF